MPIYVNREGPSYDPTCDPEHQLYDFYVLSSLYQLIKAHKKNNDLYGLLLDEQRLLDDELSVEMSLKSLVDVI
jgi:hypothetical protein